MVIFVKDYESKLFGNSHVVGNPEVGKDFNLSLKVQMKFKSGQSSWKLFDVVGKLH